ncbi:hypothetical protein NQ315_001574 [Exocentrus adspersus]|uniref:Uncharacterized protein n=1 Tax=Exocentrus adspersus TaxID=1586481 RepID=A0AAV8W8T8_9CUCU|nr:hypothetical protein NQ315_001574 [Exocentrus adspersus]
MNCLVIASVALLAAISAASASIHGLGLVAVHNPHHWGDHGPSGVVTGYGASGPSGTVTGAGAAGPSGIVTGHGPVGPTGPAGHGHGIIAAPIVAAAPLAIGHGAWGLAGGHGAWGLGHHGW